MINDKRVIAVVSARMGSTRLPGKVLLPLCEKPILFHIVERLRHSKYIDEVIIATSVNTGDNAIEKFCIDSDVRCYRGSEEDVLARVYEAAKMGSADIIYRGMGDSPLVDWRIVDKLIELLEEGGYDFVANEITEPTYPIGFDATVFTMSALKDGYETATHPEMREHVTVHIKTNPKRYNIGALIAEGEMIAPHLRLTLDTPLDYQVITRVFDALYPLNPDFSAIDTLDFLKKNPEVSGINSEVAQRVPTLLINN